jgi:hypothetical protein
MVYLKDVQTKWPWDPNAPEDYSDKEIYTHLISIGDASKSWKVPVLPPMNGFIYTGIRILVFGKDSRYTVSIHLWENVSIRNGIWTPLVFPLTKNIIEMKEGGFTLDIHHEESCWGKVEFIGERFDDLVENE